MKSWVGHQLEMTLFLNSHQVLLCPSGPAVRAPSQAGTKHWSSGAAALLTVEDTVRPRATGTVFRHTHPEGQWELSPTVTSWLADCSRWKGLLWQLSRQWLLSTLNKSIFSVPTVSYPVSMFWLYQSWMLHKQTWALLQQGSWRELLCGHWVNMSRKKEQREKGVHELWWVHTVECPPRRKINYNLRHCDVRVWC